MYYSFFDLLSPPFELGSQPNALFLGATHKEALATLMYGMESRKGVTVVVGEAGTGKTTLVGAAIRQANPSFTCLHITNPRLTRNEFFDHLSRTLELSPEASLSKTRFLLEFQKAAEQRIHQGGHTVLVIDEAQTVSDEVVEELRLLTNIEAEDGGRLLSVVLIGQPEFAQRLDLTEFRHLKQRVALRCTLNTLSLQDTAAFIATRIRAAGGTPASVFTREAVELIHRASRGIPRVICVLCDNALIGGFAMSERPVSRGRVAEAATDLRLAPAPASAPESSEFDVPVERADALTERPPGVASSGRVGSVVTFSQMDAPASGSTIFRRWRQARAVGGGQEEGQK